MNELQSALLEMMVWYHRFCVEHDLRYYMVGGTMLGAVRHGGFIPWDDDIDVGMPRKDYDRFRRLMETQGEQRYVLETPETEEQDYYYPFSKLYDTNTTLIENTRLQIKRGIYLDVFPLDGIGSTKEESDKNYRVIHWKYNLLLTRVTGIRKGRSWIKNTAVLAARLIPHAVLNNKKLLLSIDRECRKRDFYASNWIGNLVGAWNYKELMPREVFGTPALYSFEGVQMCGPEKADLYLKNLYGNWRQLPPKEKQIPHHDVVLLDLKTSYLQDG